MLKPEVISVTTTGVANLASPNNFAPASASARVSARLPDESKSHAFISEPVPLRLVASAVALKSSLPSNDAKPAPSSPGAVPSVAEQITAWPSSSYLVSSTV